MILSRGRTRYHGPANRRPCCLPAAAAAAAAADFEQVAASLLPDIATNPAVLPWRSSRALALAALGDRDTARTQAEAELGLARRFGASGPVGVALIACAAVGPTAERAKRLGDATDALAASEAWLEHARAQFELGAHQRRSGAARAARDPLRLALDQAARCGADLLNRRVSEELVAAGARPRRRMSSGRDALTPAELRVSRLAAEGLSNREIAQTLFITQKTVESHLARAYDKLAIESRQGPQTALA